MVTVITVGMAIAGITMVGTVGAATGVITTTDRSDPATMNERRDVAVRTSCICAAVPYLSFMMKLTLVQDQAIQALVAGAVGAETFDRVFAGIRFDEIESTMLYAFARNEDVASDIEDSYSPLIAAVASRVLNKPVDVVVVMPKVLQ
jgi:lipoprotein signal peptidase